MRSGLSRARGTGPVLSELDLMPNELAAIKRQGVIRGETRRGRTFFKLRFRLHGKVHVRYLGRDPDVVSRARLELAELQAARRVDLALRRLGCEVGPLLRAAKKKLVPLLEEASFEFHGMAVRKRKRSTQ